MDEIFHFVLVSEVGDKGVAEHKIVNFARERVPAHSVMRVLEIMERSGMLRPISVDAKTGSKVWQAIVAPQD